MHKCFIGITTIGIAAISALLLTGCNEKAELASEMEGTWVGTPTSLSDNLAGSSTIIETVSFNRDGRNATSGSIDVSASISAAGAVSDSSQCRKPFNITAQAQATALGMWEVIDDDEVKVTVDPLSITVEVDTTLFNIIPQCTEFEATDSLRNKIITDLKERITREVVERFASIHLLDDIKINKNLIKFELNNSNFVMSRKQSV